MAATDIPHFRKTKTSSQLIVHGEPYLMLSAELHNSTLGSAEFMATTNIWQNMKEMHINTLLGSVSWEQIEPMERHFDFTNLEAVVLAAREHGMKLVLLWFGSFKNALSTYVPAWVKRNVKRFPRVHTVEAGNRRRTIELLSPFSETCWTADAKAFGMLMAHLRNFDAQHSTVVMVQVENEIGLLGDYRDRSKAAEREYSKAVPEDLLKHLRTEYTRLHPDFTKRFPDLRSASTKASWKEVFGSTSEINAEEIFMANAFSKYIQQVASAGKAAYPIPLYANA
jgi:beta-galactosidase GanA